MGEMSDLGLGVILVIQWLTGLVTGFHLRRIYDRWFKQRFGRYPRY